jgi:hypothetical protein
MTDNQIELRLVELRLAKIERLVDGIGWGVSQIWGIGLALCIAYALKQNLGDGWITTSGTVLSFLILPALARCIVNREI